MMKIIVRKIIFFGILLLTFAVVQMWLGEKINLFHSAVCLRYNLLVPDF